jgi:DNA replication and repair protein RecF
MQLTHISLSNFRNFIRLETAIPLGTTLLIGANAQGKTSLLEAMYYLTSASSPHTSSDRQLINFVALEDQLAVTRIIAEIKRGQTPQRIEIRLILEKGNTIDDARLRKEVLINGIKRRVIDLAGVFNAVLFLPQDLGIIEGSPGDRRRYVDSTLSQGDPTYAAWLAEYGKVLSQRNALLKSLQNRSGEPEELTFWDEKIAGLGAKITRARSLALLELETIAQPIHEQLCRGREVIRLSYLPSYSPSPQPGGQLDLPIDASLDLSALSISELQEGIRRALRDSRAEEIARGMTLIGPNRDDLAFLSNGIQLRYYGSRGQNRTAMLALKLAEIQWLKQRTGEEPVLLLDEVMAELDDQRRQDLAKRISTTEQAILTTTESEMFQTEFREQATLWEVVEGSLRPQGG